jgi:hypothetical protein
VGRRGRRVGSVWKRAVWKRADSVLLCLQDVTVRVVVEEKGTHTGLFLHSCSACVCFSACVACACACACVRLRACVGLSAPVRE